MSKNTNLAIFVVLLLILEGLVWYHTGSFALPHGEDAIWFHAGLFTLLIGTYIVEYRLTRPNDVFVNCLVVFASTSTLSDPPNESWWFALRIAALVIAGVAMFLAWDPGKEARLQKSAWRALTYQVVTRLGRAEVLFSIVFILALLSYFDIGAPETKVFAVVWGVFVLTSFLELPTLGRMAFKARTLNSRNVLGLAHSFLAPSIVYCTRLGSPTFKLHQLVGFSQSVSTPCHCYGLIIGERSSTSENRIVVALLNTTVADSGINDRTTIVSVADTELEMAQQTVTEDELNAVKNIVGTVAKGTNISQVKFELFGSPKIATGTLLKIKSAATPVFYQVFGGMIEEEQTLKDSTRAFVEGLAEQVGVWNSVAGGFDTHDWVATERSTVRIVDTEEQIPATVGPNADVQIGHIPASNYPANVNLDDLVLYHTGILGVTGAGKSFLTYKLVEEAAAKGMKVVCIDPTGDYQRYINGAVLLPDCAAITAFLNSANHSIGIVEPAANTTVPAIVQTLRTAQVALNCCKANRTDDDILHPRPKVLVVLEEAHLLIPEWNFNPVSDLQKKVNETSQIVLQARKYGLGFLVVSQRTANVVKSILNQCNTIVSFQAFDETGFDFLRNYMGSFHVASLPNLKPRHGLIVGKASRSRRPIMVRFTEQQRELVGQLAQPMPVPVGDQPQAE